MPVINVRGYKFQVAAKQGRQLEFVKAQYAKRTDEELALYQAEYEQDLLSKGTWDYESNVTEDYSDTAKYLTWIDPPSGWKYGFPKPYDKDKHPNFRQWLLDEGYPEKDVDFGMQYIRTWTEKQED